MYRKDYILRLVEEAAKVLAKALGLREKGESEEALKEINIAHSELLKLDHEFILSHSSSEIVDSFEDGKVEMSEVLANMLILKAELLNEKQEMKMANNLFSKALDFLRYADSESGIYSFERQSRIHELENILKDK